MAIHIPKVKAPPNAYVNLNKGAYVPKPPQGEQLNEQALKKVMVAGPQHGWWHDPAPAPAWAVYGGPEVAATEPAPMPKSKEPPLELNLAAKKASPWTQVLY